MAGGALELFTAPTARWFAGAFAAPTPVQVEGWRAIAGGDHALLCAPTGSGKTLAAFLWSIDRLLEEPLPPEAERCRVLYVSPLRALSVDVERNLRAPLRGITLAAEGLGRSAPALATAVRTGDTPPRDRRLIERRPPDILITTPESLFLMLTSAARAVLRSVRWVILDEIHSVAATKRGAHLALSLERLGALTGREPRRVGLSATQRPLEEVARFLAGTGRPCAVVEAGAGGAAASVLRLAVGGAARAAVPGAPRALGKVLEIRVEVPVEDMADLERGAEATRAAAPAGEAERDQPPRRSIWPAVVPRILELIRGHRSTIVFVNSRRLAERLAGQINELAGEDLVRAHHGSIAREQRSDVEDRLKTGRLPAIVATSSLELGIDMGAVDLVVQVEAPPTVAAGIQRVGRAGHQVGEASRAVVFPKFRGDLLECAVTVERMLAGEIETTRVQRNPLDVLAQHIVAMAAMEEWGLEELHALVRRAYPFAELSPRALESVVAMLAGAYPSEEFAELRPRLVWDRLAGTLRGRAGAQRLAITSGGTIPDRGLYAVSLLDGAGGEEGSGGGGARHGRDGAPGVVPGRSRRASRRVGELDEEMVYETRPGETFILGASTWRIAEITPNQVLVVPAPGEPGKVAFWHGDALGRPVELGRALGTLLRELDAVDDAAALARLRRRSGFDERAARNLVAYVREQRAATGALPDDRTVVVERFRDQLGDWRICVLTPLGARVHAPWALAAAARLRERSGADVQAIHTDDGFALRLPDVDRPPDPADLLLDPDEVDELVTAELAGSALFAARFRECAARALLLPRRRPGERTPLWKQRQRAHDLLRVASRHPGFPITVETYRECLGDVFDLHALRGLCAALRSREVRLVVADTERASPFSSSLLFDYVAEFMYEGDQPLAERRAQTLALDRELLAELLGTAELRELLDPEAVAHLELELQSLPRARWPRDVDEASDLLRRLGDLSAEEAAARGVDGAWLAELAVQRRAVAVRIAGEVRWIAAEDAALYRDALGVALPAGLPEAVLPEVPDAVASLLRRYARTHGPFSTPEPARRFGLTDLAAEAALGRLATSGQLAVGELDPRVAGRRWCHGEVLSTLRRRSLAALRREIEPVPQSVLGLFLPAWQGVGLPASGPERLLAVIAQLQGLGLPVSVLEEDVLPARVRDYSPAHLDELLSVGEVVWVGRGALGPSDGRVALHLRAHAGRLLPGAEGPAGGDLHARLRAALAARGAAFFPELHRATGGGDVEGLVDALWDLVWAGEVTNDSFAPLRVLGPRRSGARRSTRRPPMRLSPPRAQGRWSLVGQLADPGVTPTERLHAGCAALLERYGVLTRESVAAEGLPGGFAALYPVLRAMEEAGRIRRGYFVDGLGASQFALPGAVDRLRALRDEPAGILALAAVDPANPYGAAAAWPASGEARRPTRVAGAYVVLDGGEPRLYLERGGRSLLTLGPAGVEHVAALVAAASRGGRRLEIQAVDGEPVDRSGLAPCLRDAGFGPSPRGLVRYPERRLAPARG